MRMKGTGPTARPYNRPTTSRLNQRSQLHQWKRPSFGNGQSSLTKSLFKDAKRGNEWISYFVSKVNLNDPGPTHLGWHPLLTTILEIYWLLHFSKRLSTSSLTGELEKYFYIKMRKKVVTDSRVRPSVQTYFYRIGVA